MTRNVKLITKLSALLLAGAVTAGCEAKKSATPTSPNVAGPISGVAITQPGVKSPINGAEVVNTEPLRLTFNNSATNGQRTLWYVVELASDREFNQRLYSNSKVVPSDGQQTSVVVDATLGVEKTYFWRVKAEDGANSSDYSSVAHFDLVPPVALGPPTPISPTGGQTVGNKKPELQVAAGTLQGRPGYVENRFIVATDAGFSNVVWTGAGPIDNNRTIVTSGELAANKVYYWRTYASNGVDNSASSATHSFKTPADAVTPGPGPGGPGPGLPPTPGPGTRTPDPAPGQRLPLPGYGAAVVEAVARQYPNALQNSCHDHGGNWEFMDRLVDALRQYDSRWGYNGKRGNANDPSKDVVDYHYGRGASENSTDVYIIDVIANHCGVGSAGPAWIDQTDVTVNSGTIGRWTGRGRFSN